MTPRSLRPASVASPEREMLAEPGLPRFTGWLQPFVDAAARNRSSIHRKLLSGFLIGAFLLVVMAVLSLLVIGRMNARVVDLDHHQLKQSRAQQMLYTVTAQSHYRAMALLTKDAKYNTKIDDSKKTFVRLLDEMERDDPAEADFFENVRVVNDGYSASGNKVLALYQAQRYDEATQLHLKEEHPASHVLEAMMRTLINSAEQEMAQAQTAFRSDRALLTSMVIGFSGTSVLVALLLGFILSWGIILPVRKVEYALEQITAGHFGHRVEMPNRDEFGKLTTNLNSTSERLEQLFEDQRTLTARLRQANVSFARASEAKSRFLTGVSHELRTPMNAILGFTEALLGGVDGPLNEAQKESLGWVQRGGRDLLGLINEILDLSKIEAGQLTIDAAPFDPRELVEAVVAQHRSLAAQKGIRFAWHDDGAPAEVVLDRQRVRQILVNLVGNALKFTANGEVNVGTSRAEGGALHVTVRDTGPGIAANQLEAVFEEFRQVEGVMSGTGLGLAISRRLARAMGGDVTVESRLGAGSVFHVSLPPDCRAASAGSGGSEPQAVHDGERTLLSVDDDPSVAPLLQKMLVGHGYRVTASRSAATAASDARRVQPAAILLDILMPERNGHEVLRQLKTDPATSRIPVIIVSVVDAAEAPEDADGYLSKPVQQTSLLHVLDEHLGVPEVTV